MTTSQLNPVVTITAKTHPYVCGVGDYTVNLVKYFNQYQDIELSLLTGKSCESFHGEVPVFPVLEGNTQKDYEKLLNLLNQASVKIVVLQYAPYLYNSQGYDLNLVNFWKQCAQSMQTVLIVHETYYWFLRYPGTWFKGIVQAHALKALALSSDSIFCGSEQYSRQLQRLVQDQKIICYLPIPNNIAPNIISSQQKDNLRQQLNISPDSLVLTLYGCIGSIRKSWVIKLDRYLRSRSLSVTWLFLGNAQSLNISCTNPVVRPGYLSADILSQYLQISTLLIMPHEFGVSAKRGSLMSAIEHKLPILGTDGDLTDSFLKDQPSIFLVPDGIYSSFQSELIKILSMLSTKSAFADLTEKTYAYYQENLSWRNVVTILNQHVHAHHKN
ncbi:slr1073 [Synechocystis sp. PCC 6803]|uniref:Slr1073 protein n=1 Tax=Synechocystis sp. (strain ATCC 27184 / PCC 6803 / Kazusa) TaxID=1111708 RepID=P72909_SYNY3|nr:MULTISPECIES: glycosyltransferase [unclassified Synechocystis]BAM50637.1 hypothetical protein BEST7613_1706 [Synechocystis sp. PCC 6803] [Bacillus subtilis BEST7613]AGF50614.1 hypothetical protein MYO_13530 [Synechocystis sp. PCC 6803]ALJ66691.1 hypothetical protein AOY38_01800 [Synechocystis sp. PCC 6803]AVP88535.1 glycosyltransferase family 1 protein [Synechocystis sp. IPPAS B-1465]MBD2617213.1 glycosyltransferase [Synechocystis sp. FACHB-898]